MTIYLPHTANLLAPVEPYARLLSPRQLARWMRDTALWKDTGAQGIPIPRPLERLLRAMKVTYSDDNELIRCGGAVTWSSYVTATIAPVGWWQMTETGGVTAANSGSLGAAANGTITSCALGQTSPLGANTAFLYDGAISKITVPNLAGIANLLTYEYIALVNATNAGEANVGAVFVHGSAGSNNAPRLIINSATLVSLAALERNTVPSSFLTTTTTGITAATWTLLFLSYENVTNRKVQLFKGISGAATEYGYSAQPAMTGTYLTPATPLVIGNASDQGITWAGPIGATMVVNRQLVAGERTQLTLLAGV